MFSKRLVSFSMWIDRTRWARNTWAMAAIFVLTMAVIADMVGLHTYSTFGHFFLILSMFMSKQKSVKLQLSGKPVLSDADHFSFF